jgi:hypothetical protein
MSDIGLGCIDWWEPTNPEAIKQEISETDEHVE